MRRSGGGGPRRWQVVAVRVLGLVALIAFGAPVAFVFTAWLLAGAAGLAGRELTGVGGVLLTAVVTALLVTPLVWFAGRLELEGAGLRRREVRAWAEAHGWSIDGRPGVFEHRWASFPFGGPRGRVLNLIYRSDERGTVHSLTYVADSVPRHVVASELPLDGPSVRLAPRAALRTTEPGIALEWAAFNERWHVESDRPRYAHAVLHPRMMERLVEPDADGLSVLFEGSDVVVHAPGRTALSRIEPMADLVLDLAALVPAFVGLDNPPRPTTRRAGRGPTMRRKPRA